MNSARYPYTYQSHVYSGKPTEKPNEFYVQGTENYIKFLVERLSQHRRLSGRNITIDRLYTGFPIAEWLLNRNITTLGTMQHNRVGIPPKLKETRDKDILSKILDDICNILGTEIHHEDLMKEGSSY